MVSEAGLEPAPSYGYAPQTYVSAGSTTPTQSCAVVADTRYYTIVFSFLSIYLPFGCFEYLDFPLNGQIKPAASQPKSRATGPFMGQGNSLQT